MFLVFRVAGLLLGHQWRSSPAGCAPGTKTQGVGDPFGRPTTFESPSPESASAPFMSTPRAPPQHRPPPLGSVVPSAAAASASSGTSGSGKFQRDRTRVSSKPYDRPMVAPLPVMSPSFFLVRHVSSVCRIGLCLRLAACHSFFLSPCSSLVGMSRIRTGTGGYGVRSCCPNRCIRHESFKNLFVQKRGWCRGPHMPCGRCPGIADGRRIGHQYGRQGDCYRT
jgi:hypothetical protein